MISVSTVGINTNYPNLYMYDQCKYMGDTNYPNLYMYDQCKFSGCKHQQPKPLQVDDQCKYRV